MSRTLKIAGITLAAVAVAATVAALLVQEQMDRHQRNLFSPFPMKRLACLGHMARSEPSVERINLLRDFVAWEPKKLLRNRARVILKRWEDQALDKTAVTSSDQG